MGIWKITETWTFKAYLLLNIFFYASGGLLLVLNPGAAEGVWYFPDGVAARWVWMLAELFTSMLQGWAFLSQRKIPFLLANASVIGLSLSFASFVTLYPLLSHGESDIARTILWLWVTGVHIFAFAQFWYGTYRERETIRQLREVIHSAHEALERRY